MLLCYVAMNRKFNHKNKTWVVGLSKKVLGPIKLFLGISWTSSLNEVIIGRKIDKVKNEFVIFNQIVHN